MKNLIIGSIAAAALLAGPALAADMPVKAPVKPVVEQVYTWTGFYVGGSIGAAWSKIDENFVFPPDAAVRPTRTVGIFDGHIGAQYQFTNLVIGVEAMAASTFNKDLGSDGCNPAENCSAGSVRYARLDDALFTIGGRAGWAFNQWLPYIAGGWARTSYKQMVCIPGFCPLETYSWRADGSYVGGGFDYAVAKGWIVGFEYRHYMFRTAQAAPVFNPPGGVGVNEGDAMNLRPRLDTFELRLSYLFNAGAPR